MFWLVPLSLLIIFEIVADIFAKEYSLQNKWIFWAAAILSYVVANAFWLWAIKGGSGLARGAVIFSVASAVLAIIIGWYFYHEDLSTRQIIGLAVGVVSLALILWE